MQNDSTPLANNSMLVAYIVLVPRDAEPILAALRALAARSVDPASGQAIAAPDKPQLVQPEDPWLNHCEAVQYLGVSKSTLYHYACEQRIECRKLCGRLQYRRSTLDRFKEEQIRPARRSARSGSIITSALSSGK
jgi:predicted DNA-binding transcriptional regulator AlpA